MFPESRQRLPSVAKLVDVVECTQPDELFVQETHYRHGREHRNYIPGYILYHSSLPRNRIRPGKRLEVPQHQQHNRAGVMIAIRAELSPTLKVERLTEPDNLRGYMLPLRVDTDRGKMLIINVYLPPDDRCREMIIHEMADWIDKHRHVGEPILMGGDFNAA